MATQEQEKKRSGMDVDELTVKRQKKRRSSATWMRDPIDVSQYKSCPLDSFASHDNSFVSIDPRLKKALVENMGYTYLLPAQLAVWKETAGYFSFQRDLYLDFPPGSGKTLAYVLPILHRLSTRKCNRIQAIVVLPNHELALQVKNIFDNLAPAVGLSVGLADSNFNSLGPVEILVATPRSLIFYVKIKSLAPQLLQYLVVDETDMLITEPYKYWLPTYAYPDAFLLYARLATIYLSDASNQDLGKLKKLLCLPLFLTSRPTQYQLPQQLKSFKVVCTLDLKPFYLLALLETLKGETCIVFTSSIKSADWLCTALNSFEDLQIKIKVYSRRQAQPIRRKTLAEFRTGKIQLLICPDETERAVEVEEVKNVINYDLPAHSMTYVHRACQTARAGQSGNCFTLLTEEEVTKLKSLLHLAGNESCADYPIPSKAAESFHATYIKVTGRGRYEQGIALLPCSR
ncbi:hypothetical protein ABFS83_13G178000 [Erythranthe nasuta]